MLWGLSQFQHIALIDQVSDSHNLTNQSFLKIFPTKAFPKPDDDKKEVRSALDKDLLRDIVKGLDILRGPTANWEDFAKQEKISVAKDKGELHRFGSSPLENPTAKLFQVLAKKKPQLKLGELYDALSSVSVKRVSTAHLLKVPNGMCYAPVIKLLSRLRTVILK